MDKKLTSLWLRDWLRQEDPESNEALPNYEDALSEEYDNEEAPFSSGMSPVHR
jgi:hypothetical protein